MLKIELHRTHRKFPNDNIRFEDDRFRIETMGVFLGISTRERNKFTDHIIASYKKNGEKFIRDMRGSFSLYLFDKSADKHLIYTNHTGDKKLFYYHSEDTTIISSSMQTISTSVASMNRTLTLDDDSAYYMLTYGYMFGNRTLFKEVKRLKPGHYLILDTDGMRIERYFTLNNVPDPPISEGEAVEQIDELFRKAIQLEFEKDLEYGYTPLSSLSGGLDSRMTTWVGHDMGYTNMVNFTFARPGAPDMTIPEKITKKLNHRWIFKALDSSLFYSFEEVNRITGGCTYFLPVSHSKYALDQTDFTDLGILHTGQLGDVILGTYLKSKENGPPAYTMARSTHFLDRLPKDELGEYENQEQMLFLNRGFNYILSGNLPAFQFTESVSPFLDVDFLAFALSLPLEFRLDHRIYKKWIKTKYPGAAEFVWEKLGTKIDARCLRIRGKNIPVKKLPNFVVKGIKYHLGITEGENQGMNPFQYWYNSDQDVQEFLDQYFREYIDIVPDRKIKQDCEYLFSNGNVHEKAMALTLLATINLFWN